MRIDSRSVGYFASVFAMLTGSALRAEPVLSQWNDSLTTYNPGASAVQKVIPLVQQRGSDLEGGARCGSGQGPIHVSFASAFSAGTLGGIDLGTLTWMRADIDLALPTDGPSVVIGRTFNHRQGSGSSITASDGPQGVNWFQSAMSEIVFVAGATADKDMVYLLLGAGRFLEYKRTGVSAIEFKGVNGAPGIFKYVAGGGGNYDTYELTDATGSVCVFWGASGSHTADWQFWKKTDAAGRTAYVGHKTTHATAVADYNGNGTPKKIYQEYGTAPDERRYTFTYGTTIGGIARLTEVKAETKTGGTWASPTNLTEVGHVIYDYYTTTSNHSVTTTDSFGNAGDLKTVKIRTPLTDTGATLSTGIYDERVKYYRYYNSYNNSDGRRGHSHSIKLALGFEGCRRFDWGDNGMFDDSFAGSGVLTSDLKAYSDAYFEYESSAATQRITSAFFNGECGCSGGSNGQYAFVSSANGAYANGTGYDTAWCTRTVIALPDGSYQTRYFDELGQPLSTVISDIDPATSGALYWVTGIDRNAAGRVVAVHSPSNCSGYAHNNGLGNPDGAITYYTNAGLVTFLDRYASGEPSYDSSGELDGLISGTGFKTGTSGTATYTSKSVLGKRSLTVGSSTLVRPLVTEVRAFYAATGNYSASNTHNTTTYAYAWWNTGTSSNPLYIIPQSITTTLPAIATANNGANTTHNAVNYYRKDGRVAITVGTDGVYTAAKYNNCGLAVRSVRDADPSVSGDFDSGYAPSDFSLSTTSNGGLAYANDASYDAVGRTITTTARPGSVAERVAHLYYSRLSDHRLAAISSPVYSNSGSPTWHGPFNYNVANQNGRGEFSAVLGPPSGVAVSMSSWIDETQSDPVDALDSSLAGASRVYVKGVATTIYDTPGVKVSENRQYVVLASSGPWGGSAGTDYDRTVYTYDNMGRSVRVVDPTGTVDRTVYDGIGRVYATWTGTIDSNGWSASSGNGTTGAGAGQTDDLTQTSAIAYDGGTVGSALVVGDGYVTTRIAYVQGHATTGIGDSGTQRASTFTYDVRGNLITTARPQAPHYITNYDVMRRPTSNASYSSASGFSGSSVTSTTTNRVALSETFYDERGNVYKSTPHKIAQTGGSAGSSIDSLDAHTWYDSASRAIKSAGTSLTKTFYDRLGRATHTFVLARTNDSVYADADDVGGDVVLEENQTVFDDVDKTGLVVMVGTIIRNYDDSSTTGLLDSGADSSRYKITAANLSGRVQIRAMWYDALDRQIDSVVYGTNGGTDFDRRPSGWLSAPNRGGTALRTSTVFDGWGSVDSIEQPKIRTGTTGYLTKYFYDQALRRVASAANYTAASVPLTTEERDNDIYTRTEYDAGRVKYYWADVRGNDTDGHAPLGGFYNGTHDPNDQVTEYVYGVARSGSGSTPPPSTISSNRLLQSIKYEEQTGGQVVNDRSVFMAYNAQEQTVGKRNQNGTIIDTMYDTGGRTIVSKASTLGSGIDGDIRRIEMAYDSRGFLSTVTQYDAVTSGNVKDEIKRSYDDWGNLVKFESDVDSIIGGSGINSVSIEYTFSKASEVSASMGNSRRSGLRKTSTVLMNGGSPYHEVEYHYLNTSGSDTLYDDDAGRVTRISNSGASVTFAEYRYAGMGWVVRNKLSEPGLLQKLAAASGAYSTFSDDFDRPIRYGWVGDVAGNSATYYDLSSAYDANSNLAEQTNNYVDIWSNERTVDALNRLGKYRVGKESGGAISDANTWHFERWSDSSGNIKLTQRNVALEYLLVRGDPTNVSLKKDADVAGATYNKRNERQAWPDAGDTKLVTAGSYTANPDPTPGYDKAGQLVDDDTRTMAADRMGYLYVYDAWGRMRYAKSHAGGNPVVEEFRYNGLSQRIGWHFDENASGAVDGTDVWRYHQYNERGQEMALYLGSNAYETYAFHEAGIDGRGSSSALSMIIYRERDTDVNGKFDERRYYLFDQSGNVTAIVDTLGQAVERYRYDAYGRPASHSPADVGAQGGVFGPDGVLDNNDLVSFTTQYFNAVPKWTCDMAKIGAVGIPDGSLTGADFSYHGALVSVGHNGGIGVMSDAAVDNRKGFKGLSYDVVLAGNGVVSSGGVARYVGSLGTYSYVVTDEVKSTDCKDTTNTFPDCLACCENKYSGDGRLGASCSASCEKLRTVINRPIIHQDKHGKVCQKVCHEIDDPGTVICVNQQPVACVCQNNMPPKERLDRDEVSPCFGAHERINTAMYSCVGKVDGDTAVKIAGTQDWQMACNEALAYYMQIHCLNSVTCSKMTGEAKCQCLGTVAGWISSMTCRMNLAQAKCDSKSNAPVMESQYNACDAASQKAYDAAYKKCMGSP